MTFGFPSAAWAEASDVQAPVVVSFDAPGSVDVSGAAATVPVSAHVTDDVSGVASVEVAMVIGQHTIRTVGRVELTRSSGTALDGIWEGSITLPRYLVAGTYRFNVVATDNVDRQRSVSGIRTITVISAPDMTPPVLVSVDSSPALVDVSQQPATVTVSARVTDDRRVAAANVSLRVPATGEVFGADLHATSAISTDVTFEGTLTLPRYVPNGVYPLEISVADTADNRVVRSDLATITVTGNPDETPPVMQLPSNLSVEATDRNGAMVTYSASATDTTDGQVPVSCVPASGTRFRTGITTVRCTTSDAAGNTAAGTFTVTVRRGTLASCLWHGKGPGLAWHECPWVPSLSAPRKAPL